MIGALGVEDVTRVYSLAEKRSGDKINLELERRNKEVMLKKRREVRGVPTPQGLAAGGLLKGGASSE